MEDIGHRRLLDTGDLDVEVSERTGGIYPGSGEYWMMSPRGTEE